MTENATYTISDFIKEYSSAATDAAKSKICKNHMTRTYVPVLEKYVALSMGFNNSSRSTNGMIQINRFMNYIMYTIITLSLYYDFINTDEGCNYTNLYDSLVESGLRDALLIEIGEDELDEISRINGFILSDAKENEMAPHNYIAHQITRFAEVVGEKLTPEMMANIKSMTKDAAKE